MNRLKQSISLIRRINVAKSQVRLLNTTSLLRSSHSDSHADSSHSANKKSSIFDMTEVEKRGYVYRETRNLDGNFGTFVGKCLVTFLWFWIFYNFMVRPEDFFGHNEYPDTSKWTDEELGITDDE
jgi:hypothetical protein